MSKVNIDEYISNLPQLSFPSSINLEITNRCNLKCRYCSNWHKNFRKKGFMEENLLYKITTELKEIMNNGDSTIQILPSLGICGVGEPTLHPNFESMLTQLDSMGIPLTLITDGILLSDKVQGHLLNLKNLTQINISVNAIRKESYRDIHGKDFFEKVMQNVKALVKFKNQLSKKIDIQISVQRIKDMDFDEIKATVLFWNNWLMDKDYLYIREVKTLGGIIEDYRYEDDLIMEYSIKNRPNSLRELRNRLQSQGIDCSKLLVEDWLLSTGGEYYTLRMPCQHPFYMVMIFYNGDVTVCCADFNGKLVVGNIKNNTISEIWNGDKMHQFKEDMLKMKIEKYPFCSKCDEWYKGQHVQTKD